MKIMIVAPHFHPKVGGVENYVLSIAQGLKTQNHQIFVVTSNHSGKDYLQERVQGLRVIRLPTTFKFSNTPVGLKWYWQLREIIKTEKPDLINAHAPVPGLADMAFLARGKSKFILTYHAGSMKKGRCGVDLILGCYESIFLKRMLKKSDSIISVYPQFIQKLIGDANNINYIPPGVDTKLFRPIKNIRQQYDVLYVGRVERTSSWKGIETLIHAIEKISKSKPNISLRIVGSGDAVEDYQKLTAQLKISKNVTFTGFLAGKELVKAYNCARMLVLPSTTDSESFGMVLIEAMACKIPVVGSNIGGIPNVIHSGSSGLLVRPNDPKSLKIAILKILSDRKFASNLSRSGQNTAKQKFSLQSTMAKTNMVIDSVAKPNIVQVAAYYPPHTGGLEVVVQKISMELARRNYRVTVLASGIGAAKQNKPYFSDGVHVVRLRAREFVHMPFFLRRLFFQLMRVPHGSVVHVHVAQAFIPEIALVAAKIRRLPVILHVHTDMGPSGRAGALIPLYKRFSLAFALRHSDLVITPSESYKRLLIRKYNLDNTIVAIPNGVNEIFFAHHAKHQAFNNVFQPMLIRWLIER